MVKPFTLALLFAAAAFGQTSGSGSAPVGDFTSLPSYIVGIGAEFNHYTRPESFALLTVGVRIAKTNLYSWSTMELATVAFHLNTTTPQPAVLRTGVAYVFAHTGSCSAFLLAQGTVPIGTQTNAVNALSGGVGLWWQPWHNSKFYFGPLLRLVPVTSVGGATSAAPAFEFMISKGF